MPLAFRSLDRGVVAFGFFNIDTDLLLLERTLLWGDDFSAAVRALAAAAPGADATASLPAYTLREGRTLGHVMGAIHGFDRSGLIGALYDRYPFPEDPAAFHQRAEGVANRPVVEALLEEWTEPVTRSLIHHADDARVEVAGIAFDEGWFRDLVAYVWRGGYPRWLDERRPEYVEEMRSALERSTHPLFAEQPWEMLRCQT